MEQVIVNLVSNALRYSEDAGEVIVQVESAGTQARVRVINQGIGIPSDQLSQVFEPFSRGANAHRHYPGGLGLGLHIARDESPGGTRGRFAWSRRCRSVPPSPSICPSARKGARQPKGRPTLDAKRDGACCRNPITAWSLPDRGRDDRLLRTLGPNRLPFSR